MLTKQVIHIFTWQLFYVVYTYTFTENILQFDPE